jgi:hypothetical protein
LGAQTACVHPRLPNPSSLLRPPSRRAAGFRFALRQVSYAAEGDVYPAAVAYNRTVNAAAACAGCEAANTTGWSNYTRWLCGLPSPERPLHADHPLPAGGLPLAGWTALAHASQFVNLADAAPNEAAHTVHVIRASSGWHLWAAMLPLYALLTTAAAVASGAIFGRRNLLLLAQVRARRLRSATRGASHASRASRASHASHAHRAHYTHVQASGRSAHTHAPDSR